MIRLAGKGGRLLTSTARAAAAEDTAEGSAKVAVEGKKVKVHFELTRDDTGDLVDSSRTKGPLQFVCGGGEVLPGLDQGVLGMRAGEERNVPIAGAGGYGERDEAKVIDIERERIPPHAEVKSLLTLQGPRGPMRALLKDMNETHAILDFNHPMAGVQLTMKVKLIEVTEGPPGVEVETLTPGDGTTHPKVRDRLKMHYVGTLADGGAKFDSSYDRGEPIEFQIGVGQVIPGWDRGVMRMTLGERARLSVPAHLGYGERGTPDGAIPPNSDLIFEVELLEISGAAER